MPAADYILYRGVDHPDDDTSAEGGVIQDTAHATGGAIPVMAPLASNVQVEALSDGTDTRDLTVEGRLASGALAEETKALTSGTPVVFDNTYSQILRATLDAKDGANTVTLRVISAGATVATFTPDVVEVVKSFRKAASAGGAQERYETQYFKNTGAKALNDATVALTGESVGSGVNLYMGVAASKGDVASRADRKTDPVPSVWVDDSTATAVPTNLLDVSERIAVWLRQHLDAGAAAQKGTWTLQLAGNEAA